MAETKLGIQRVGLQPLLPLSAMPELSVSSSAKSGTTLPVEGPCQGSQDRNLFPHSKPGEGGCYIVGTPEIYFE